MRLLLYDNEILVHGSTREGYPFQLHHSRTIPFNLFVVHPKGAKNFYPRARLTGYHGHDYPTHL